MLSFAAAPAAALAPASACARLVVVVEIFFGLFDHDADGAQPMRVAGHLGRRELANQKRRALLGVHRVRRRFLRLGLRLALVGSGNLTPRFTAAQT